MAAVTLQQLRKSYDGRADVLAGIDLHIDDGEFVVLVGPSGCGKSTLLRMLCGLESITGGELSIGGRVVNHLPPAERGIAMVFQSYALYPHMTVRQNMAFGLKVAGADKATIAARIERAAAMLKIDALLKRYPRELSGGQRQRVAIGRAIVREPQLFLFDEPLSNLDAALRVQTRHELARLHRELGATTVYVTHDQVEAMTLGDKIVVMHGGHIQQVGSPLALYQEPCNVFVAGFIGSPRMNLLDGELVDVQAGGVRVRLAGGEVLTAAVDGSGHAVGERVRLGVRAEDLHIARAVAGGFSGCVVLAEHLGDSTHVYLDIGQGRELVLRAEGRAQVQIGQDLHAVAPSGAFHVFGADERAFPRLKPHAPEGTPA